MGIYDNSWGIYTQTVQKVFDIDSLIDLRYENGGRVSDFPIEKGSFVSYNKVSSPFRAKVRASVGGSKDRIAAFISALDEIVKDTKLYIIITPEKIYLNVNVEYISYSRSCQRGYNLIMADISIKEIRQVAPQYAAVKRAASKKKIDTGKNQTQKPPPDLVNVDAKTAFLQGFRRQVGGA
jgi:hypothetical protein